MTLLMLLIEFVGSWLLFAGPIYQAALELNDEDIEFEKVRAIAKSIEKPKKYSMWWWLIPPLKLYLMRKSQHDYEARYMKALEPKDVEAVVSFRSKASAWQFVALGGLLLAINGTYQIIRHERWSYWIILPVTILMVLISITNMVLSLKRATSAKSL